MADIHIQGAGPQENIEAQVDPTHQNLRLSAKPLDHVVNGVIGGHYGLSVATGLLAAQTAANSQIFSVRFVSNTKTMILKKLYASLHVTTVYSAGANVVPADFEFILARSYTANASGGNTALVPAATSQSARSIMAPSEFVSAGIIMTANTGTLTAGTQTLDSHPYSYATAGAPGVALGSLGNAVLFENTQWGKFPLVFANNQGFVVRITQQLAGAAGTGVCRAVFAMDWVEVGAY